jgi:hypothetical protein
LRQRAELARAGALAGLSKTKKLRATMRITTFTLP